MGNIDNPIIHCLQLINFYSANPYRQTLFEILLFISFLLIIRTIIYGYKTLKFDIKNGTDAENWPQVEGVINKNIVHLTGPGEDGMWYNEFDYYYNVKGKIYTSNRFSYFSKISGNGSEGSCKEFQREYPQGKRVQVYYNPAEPSEAVLSTESGNQLIYSNVFRFLFGIVLVSIVLIILLLFSGWVACTSPPMILILYFIVLPLCIFLLIRKRNNHLSVNN